MQPHIFVTSAPEDAPEDSTISSGTNASYSSQGTNGHSGRLGHLSVPTWETARRPSFLPNDTEMNIRPKVRKMSTYDLSINDTMFTDSLESYINGGAHEDLVDNEPPPCLSYITQWVVGDVQYITDFLDRWPFFSFILPLKLVNALLRTLGAPMLANNPFSGALILLALLLEAPLVAVWSLGAILVALLMALVLRQPQHIISSGQVTQHGLLLGLLVGHSMTHHPEHPLFAAALALTLTAAISVILGIAVSTWLSQTNLPGLTVSYILLGAALCQGLGYHDFSTAVTVAFPNTTITPSIQWSMVLQGVARGAGQVYGCGGLAPSCLVLAAMMVFSPVVFLQAVLGTLLGALCGVFVSQPPYSEVYSGVYGCHSLLTGLSLGGFFFVLNFYSSLTAACGAVFSALLFHTLHKSSMPVLTTPHVVATLILLHARIRGGQLKRVDLIYLTFPEMHRRLFRPGNAIEDCAIA
ncbi:urea transporter 2-like [Homarus americanus]|uniref:urea transporter 2-like n=1 Tax=Homarus americanus TaxID=6706 RepID=UPI001C43AC10|nr:urea transporter 2-like [Homarus americanus]